MAVEARPTSRAHRPRLPTGRRRSKRSRIAAYTLGGVIVAVGIAWVGLRVEPQPLSPTPVDAGEVGHAPLSDDLPEPVSRFYRTLYGDEMPVVDTAIITGRGHMRVAGVTFPARWRFSHVTGRDYRHYIDLSLYGVRLLAVSEWYLDGTARLELPFGVSDGPQVDQGANLGLWAETIFMPSVWLTDPRVSWEPIDATSAHLNVPFGDSLETFTVTFDPDTGLLSRMESMRYKGETDQTKSLWINEVLEWGQIDGHPAPTLLTLTWADEATPWATLRTEGLTYNADLNTYISRHGP